MLVELIAKETGVNLQYLEHVIRTASRRYKTYDILKKSGGLREINHPAPVVKFLQRWAVRNIISHFPVHSSVTSYKEGDNVLRNALAHVGQDYLLKMDFRDFFPSIKSIDVQKALQLNRSIPIVSQLNETDELSLLSIVCRHGSLTIGAPSSPALSNAILFGFDEELSVTCSKLGVVCTRYADDLSFSSNKPNTLAEIPGVVAKILDAQVSPRLQINDEKTVFSSRKHRRVVTGITLTSDKKISIGRKKKRWLKSACFKFINGEMTSEEASNLRGYLSFVHSVEPELLNRLKKKFGEAKINEITQQPLISLKKPPVLNSGVAILD